MADEKDKTLQKAAPTQPEPSIEHAGDSSLDGTLPGTSTAVPSFPTFPTLGSAPAVSVVDTTTVSPGIRKATNVTGFTPVTGVTAVGQIVAKRQSEAPSRMTVPPGEKPPESVRLPDGALHVAGTRYEDLEMAWVTDPWTQERIVPVIQADHDRADRAAQAAKRTFETTRRMPGWQRRRILKEITRRIVHDREEIAAIITRESGKPKTLARFEVDRAIVTFGLGAEEAVRIGGEVVPLDVTEQTQAYRGQWQRVPRGPVLAITPFNFPLNLVAHKVAPAIACGAPVVLKPAPQTPLTALKLAEIVRASGARVD